MRKKRKENSPWQRRDLACVLVHNTSLVILYILRREAGCKKLSNLDKEDENGKNGAGSETHSIIGL